MATSKPKKPTVSPSKPTEATPQAPEIIELLRKVEGWRSLPDADKAALLASVRIILSTWDANHDPKEITALLGLKKRLRRRAN